MCPHMSICTGCPSTAVQPWIIAVSSVVGCLLLVTGITIVVVIKVVLVVRVRYCKTMFHTMSCHKMLVLLNYSMILVVFMYVIIDVDKKNVQ